MEHKLPATTLHVILASDSSNSKTVKVFSEGYSNSRNDIKIILTRRPHDNQRLRRLLTDRYNIDETVIQDIPSYLDSIICKDVVNELREVLGGKLKNILQHNTKCSNQSNSIPDAKNCDSIFILSPEAGRIFSSTLQSLLGEYDYKGDQQSMYEILKQFSLGAVGQSTAMETVHGLGGNYNSTSASVKLADGSSDIPEISTYLISAIYIPRVGTKQNLITTFPWPPTASSDRVLEKLPYRTTILLGPSSGRCPESTSKRKFHYLRLYIHQKPSEKKRIECSSNYTSSRCLVVFTCPTAIHNWVSDEIGQESSQTNFKSVKIAVCIGPTTAIAATKIFKFDQVDDLIHQDSLECNFGFRAIVYPANPSLENLASAIHWASMYDLQ